MTLLVTPDQAAKLDLAQSRGMFHLALRGPKDDEPATPRIPICRLGQEEGRIRTLRGGPGGVISFPAN